jgi:hypothetical protein
MKEIICLDTTVICHSHVFSFKEIERCGGGGGGGMVMVVRTFKIPQDKYK